MGSGTEEDEATPHEVAIQVIGSTEGKGGRVSEAEACSGKPTPDREARILGSGAREKREAAAQSHVGEIVPKTIAK